MPCFRHSDNSGYALTQNRSPYSSRRPSSQVVFKQTFSLNSISQIVRFMFSFDFFLNLGCYYNSLYYRYRYLNRQHIWKKIFALYFIVYIPMSPAGPPSITSELKMSVQPAKPIHPSGTCVTVTKSLCFFCI